MALADQHVYQQKDVYTTLDTSRHEIRVMSLKPGLFDDELQCEVQPTSLDNPCDYEALSYTWGVPSYVSYIVIGREKLQIHHNLNVALRHLRSEDRPRTLWTDAICINQALTNEKNDQVTHMSKVYERATRTLVWLGTHADDSAEALPFVKEVVAIKTDGELKNNLKQPANIAKWEAILKLCSRDYWKRYWTAQEIVCGKDPVMMLGYDTLSFADFGQIAQTMRAYYVEALAVPHILEAGHHSRLENQQHIFALQHMYRLGGTSMPKLLDLLIMFRGHNCAMLQDRVYAVASMTGEFQSLGLRIDYGLPAGEVYIDTVKAIIVSSKKLNVICAGFGNANPDLSLPSWVPDWSAPQLWHSLGPTEVGQYAASGALLAQDVEFSSDGRILTVSGCFIGMIDTIGIPYEEVTTEPRLTARMRDVLLDWLQIAISMPKGREDVSEDTRIHQFVRTVIADRTVRPDVPEPSRIYRSMVDVIRGVIPLPDSSTNTSGTGAKTTVGVFNDHAASGVDLEDQRLQEYVLPLFASLDRWISGRRLIAGGSNVLGLGPVATQVGDFGECIARLKLLPGCTSQPLHQPFPLIPTKSSLLSSSNDGPSLSDHSCIFSLPQSFHTRVIQ